jgi:hypothetical protein
MARYKPQANLAFHRPQIVARGSGRVRKSHPKVASPSCSSGGAGRIQGGERRFRREPDRFGSARTYQPQVELLAYIRENGFKTYIVSAGGVDFMRAFVEDAYGVPREQVIGSSVKLRFDAGGEKASLSKLSELNIFNDRETKPLSIGLHIGRRPLLAFGNSDGDLAMMRYARSGPGPRLALLLRHDDTEREVAYDREFRLPVVRGARQGSGLRHHCRKYEAGLEGRVLIRA